VIQKDFFAFFIIQILLNTLIKNIAETEIKRLLSMIHSIEFYGKYSSINGKKNSIY